METAWTKGHKGLGRHPILIFALMIFFWDAISHAVWLLSDLHLRVHPYSAYYTWGPFRNVSNPLNEFLWGLVFLFATAGVYAFFHRNGREYSGIKLPRPNSTIWKIAIFSVVMTWVIDIGYERFLEMQRPLPPTWPLKPDWYYDLTPALLPGALIYGVLVAPLVEEYIFRGLGMGCMLERGWNPILAVLITSILFALIHTQYFPSALLLTLISGLIFGYLRLFSGSLTLPLIAHALFNLTVYLWHALQGFPSAFDSEITFSF